MDPFKNYEFVLQAPAGTAGFAKMTMLKDGDLCFEAGLSVEEEMYEWLREGAGVSDLIVEIRGLRGEMIERRILRRARISRVPVLLKDCGSEGCVVESLRIRAEAVEAAHAGG